MWRLVPLFVILGLASFVAGTRLLPTRPTPPIHPLTGRQIAGIATDANWLDRTGREQEEEPDRTSELIGITVLVEYRKEDPSIPIASTHRMSVSEARAEVEAEGFLFNRLVPGLPRQHIIDFRR